MLSFIGSFNTSISSNSTPINSKIQEGDTISMDYDEKNNELKIKVKSKEKSKES